MRGGVDQDLIIMLRDHLHWSEEHAQVGRLTVPFEQMVANVSTYNPEIGMAADGSAFGLLSNFMFWPDAMGTGSAENTRLPRPSADPYDYVPGFMPAMPTISRIKAKAGSGRNAGTIEGKAVPVRDTNLRPDRIFADIKILGLGLDPFAPAKRSNIKKKKKQGTVGAKLQPKVTKLVPGSSNAILPGIFDLNNEVQSGGLYSSPIAGGLPILWVAAAERQMLYNLGMPTWANVLVSDWSSEASNDLFFSTRIADLSGSGTVDYDRISTIASILRTSSVPKWSTKKDTEPRFGVAIVGGYAPNDPMVGRGMMTYDGFLPSGSMSFPSGPAGKPEMITYISGSGGGPVTGGAGMQDKHLIGEDADGIAHVQGHLDLRSPWYFNPGFDAPPEHGGLWDNNCNTAGVWNLTVLRWDPEAGPHAGAGPEFSINSVMGMHKWQTKTLVHVPKDKADPDPKKEKPEGGKKGKKGKGKGPGKTDLPPTPTPKPWKPGGLDEYLVDPNVSPSPDAPKSDAEVSEEDKEISLDNPYDPFDVPITPEEIRKGLDERFGAPGSTERTPWARRRAREKVIEEWWKKRQKKDTPAEPGEPSIPLWEPEGDLEGFVDLPIYPTPQPGGDVEGFIDIPGGIAVDPGAYGPSADTPPDVDPFGTDEPAPEEVTGGYELDPLVTPIPTPGPGPVPRGGEFVVDGEGRLVAPQDIWVHPAGGGAVIDSEGRYIRPLDLDELDRIRRGREMISDDLVSNVDTYARIWMNLATPGLIFTPPLMQEAYGSDWQYDRNPDTETLGIIENAPPSAYLAPFGTQVGEVMENDDSAGSGALWSSGFTTGGICLYPPTHGLDDRIMENPNCPDTTFVFYSGIECRSKLAFGTPNQVGLYAGKVTSGWQMWGDGVAGPSGKLSIDSLSSAGVATNVGYFQGSNQYLVGGLFAESVAVKGGVFYNTVDQSTTEPLTANRATSLRDRNMTVGAHLVDVSTSGVVAAATLASYRINTTSGVGTVTLPAISSANAGDEIEFIDAAGNASANPITITRTAPDAVRGGTSYVINTDYGVVRLRSDGLRTWHVTSEVVT